MNAPLCLRCRAPMSFLRTASLMVRDSEPLPADGRVAILPPVSGG